MLQPPESPPPTFQDGEMLRRSGPAPAPAPGGRMRGGQQGQSKWLWLAPLLLLTAGIGGTAVFGVLTYTRAQDELGLAKSALDDERKKREEIEGRLSGAKEATGDVVDQVAQLKKDLADAQALAKKRAKEVVKTSKKASDLEKKLRGSIQKSEGDIKADGDRVTVNLVDKFLFKSGKSDLTPRGKRVIKKLGAVLKKAKDKQIFVQGHTDDVPIPKSNKNFSSNWELSAARAITVVQYLQDEVKISGKLLGAVAFSKYRPIDKRKRAKNRRIEIVLLPRSFKFVGE